MVFVGGTSSYCCCFYEGRGSQSVILTEVRRREAHGLPPSDLCCLVFLIK